MRILFAFLIVLVLFPILSIGWRLYLYPVYHFKTTLAQAEQGDAEAQAEVGHIYTRGNCGFQIPVPCDGSEGEKWLLKSAEQGNVQGQATLGFVYSADEGLKTDADKAVRWLRAAALQGDKDSQRWLGLLYAKTSPFEPPFGARSLPKPNYEEAYFWLSISIPKTTIFCNHPLNSFGFWSKGTCVSQPNTFALKDFTRAEKHLTAEQKSAVDKRVAEWMKAHPTAPVTP